MRSRFFLSAVILLAGLMVSMPAQAEKRGAGGQGAQGYFLEPQGWVSIGIDYNNDGVMDRFEYISVYELERARQRSARTQAAQGMGQRDFRGYYPGTAPQAGTAMRTVSGTIRDMKKISLAGQEQKHQIARVKTPEGRVARVDLGPVENLKGLNLKDGDQITVHGRRGTINDKGMLMAERIEAAGRTIAVNRPFDRNLNRFSGKVLSTRTASFQTQDVPDQVFARVRLDGGETTVVNLGPKEQLRNVDLKNLKGKQISFLAHRAIIGNQVALIADRFRVDGNTVRVDWTGATARAPSEGKSARRTS
jgi:hypothetical protein